MCPRLLKDMAELEPNAKWPEPALGLWICVRAGRGEGTETPAPGNLKVRRSRVEAVGTQDGKGRAKGCQHPCQCSPFLPPATSMGCTCSQGYTWITGKGRALLAAQQEIPSLQEEVTAQKYFVTRKLLKVCARFKLSRS